MLGPCLVLLLCSCAATARPGAKQDSLNRYVDMVLSNVQIIMHEAGYDPITLPNATINFGRHDKGVVGLYDGWMRGMSNIYRSGDMDFINDNGILNGMKGKFAIGDVKGHYNGIAKYGRLGPLIDVIIKNGGGHLEFSAKLNHKTCHFHIDKFNLKHIGWVHIDIHGLGPLNWITELLMQGIVNVVKPFVTMIMETSVKGIVNKMFALDGLGPSLGPIFNCVPSRT